MLGAVYGVSLLTTLAGRTLSPNPSPDAGEGTCCGYCCRVISFGLSEL